MNCLFCRRVRKGTSVVKTSTMWLTRREKGMKEIRQGLSVKERSNVGEQTKRRGGSSWEERRKEEGQSKKRQNRGGDQKSLAQPIPIRPRISPLSLTPPSPPPAVAAARPAWRCACCSSTQPRAPSAAPSIHPSHAAPSIHHSTSAIPPLRRRASHQTRGRGHLNLRVSAPPRSFSFPSPPLASFLHSSIALQLPLPFPRS